MVIRFSFYKSHRSGCNYLNFIDEKPKLRNNALVLDPIEFLDYCRDLAQIESIKRTLYIYLKYICIYVCMHACMQKTELALFI